MILLVQHEGGEREKIGEMKEGEGFTPKVNVK